jgi:hypothetical protein
LDLPANLASGRIGKLLFQSVGKVRKTHTQSFANAPQLNNVQHSFARLVFADKRLRQPKPLRKNLLRQASLGPHFAEQKLQTTLFTGMY